MIYKKLSEAFNAQVNAGNVVIQLVSVQLRNSRNWD